MEKSKGKAKTLAHNTASSEKTVNKNKCKKKNETQHEMPSDEQRDWQSAHNTSWCIVHCWRSKLSNADAHTHTHTRLASGSAERYTRAHEMIHEPTVFCLGLLAGFCKNFTKKPQRLSLGCILVKHIQIIHDQNHFVWIHRREWRGTRY